MVKERLETSSSHRGHEGISLQEETLVVFQIILISLPPNREERRVQNVSAISKA
jgi:hypothetical protein